MSDAPHRLDLQVQFVLVHPSLPSNIGSVARAMKVMGFSKLIIVDPIVDNCTTHPDAIALASGAQDVLSQAQITQDLVTALDQSHITIALTARPRNLDHRSLTPQQVSQLIQNTPQHQFALLFGNERTGLENHVAAQCDFLCHVHTNPDYSSLNLAQAVQIMSYELSLKRGNTDTSTTHYPISPIGRLHSEPATFSQISGLEQHWLELLTAIDFFDPQSPKRLPERLSRIVRKAALETTEVNILRGIAKAIQRKSIFKYQTPSKN